MRFRLIDVVLEQDDERIVALKTVTLAEEYLADHFPNFPILPGVLMLEAMVQAARDLIVGRGQEGPVVLGEVRAVKYGAMVRPGQSLRVEVTAGSGDPESGIVCRGTGRVSSPRGDETAVSGRFTMRGLRRGPD